MTATMRAAVMERVGGGLTVSELAMPVPRAGEILVRVVGCGVCHTDLHVMKGEVGFPTPCVLGHEVSGVVEALGERVSGFAVGDRVVGSFIMPCGKCRHCVRGHEDLCELFFAYNRLRGQLYDGDTRLFRPDGSAIAMYSMGGLAEYCVIPETDLFHIPDSIPLASAAVLGCSVFTAVGAVRNVGQIRPGDTVAVVAVGGVGLNIVQAARAFGASRVIAVDIDSGKLDLAHRLGATETVDARDGNAIERVRELTAGRGVDVAFEAIGSKQTVESAIQMVDDGGAVVLVGIAPAGVAADLPIAHIVRRKIRVLGSYGARARTDMPLVIDLVSSGRIRIDALISERYTLETAADAYKKLSEGGILGRAIIEVSAP